MKRLIFTALMLIMGLLGLKCGSEGVVSIPQCEREIVDGPPPTLKLPATHAARIYGPEVRPFEFRIQLDAKISSVNWQSLREIARGSMKDVDVVIRADLQDQSNFVSVKTPVITFKGSIAADAQKHIEKAVGKWRFTPYGTGSIYYRFNIGTNKLTVDTCDLILKVPPGTMKPVPVASIWFIEGQSLPKVAFGDVKSMCYQSSIVP
jgi:hypothetical protein